MSDHARLSPSNHRWPHCPGSVREESKYSDSSGAAAIDGTGTHLLVEYCFLHKCDAAGYIGITIGEGHKDKPGGWEVDAERARRAQVMLDYVWARDTQLGGTTKLIEKRSDPGAFFGRDDWWGTCDCVTLQLSVSDGAKGKVLEVIDYKDGQMFVPAEGNSQMTSYGGGRLAEFIYKGEDGLVKPTNTPMPISDCGIETVRMTIVQPKSNTPIRYWELPAAELWQEVHQLAAAASFTDDPEAQLEAGSWCQWCKHKGNCDTRVSAEMEKTMTAAQNVGTVVSGNDTLDKLQRGELDVAKMSNNDLSKFFATKKALTSVYDLVEAELFTRLEVKGTVIPGAELKPGNSKKQWKDDDETVNKKLKNMRFKKEDIYPPKLISPAQALKHEGLTDRQLKRLSEEMIETISGDLKVKSVTIAEREKIAPEQMFANKPLSLADMRDAMRRKK